MKEKNIVNKKTKGNYCFPNILTTVMKGISQRTQYEATMMSITVILLGLMVIGLWTIIFTNFSFFTKMMTAINMGAAFIFLSSTLVTSYQQYFSYLEVMDLLEEHNSKPEEIKQEPIQSEPEEESIPEPIQQEQKIEPIRNTYDYKTKDFKLKDII